MTDPQPGAAFGVQPVTAPPVTVPTAAPAAVEVVDAATQAVDPHEGSAVPSAARARLKDRLRARKVEKRIAQLSDGEQILVVGLRSGQMDEIKAMAEEDEDSGLPASGSEQQFRMFKAMCFDPADGSPIFDDWTFEEFAEFPMADSTVIMKAVAIVNGYSTEPGKDSPSTGADDSSSSSPVD